MHLSSQMFDCRESLHVLSTVPLKNKMPPEITRRTFTVAAVSAATVALIQPTAANSVRQDDKPSSAAAQEAMSKLSAGARAEVELKLSNIFRKYGDQLNDEQKIDIRKIMAETQAGLEKMRSFPLENGDLPATIFHADQGNETR